MHSKWLIWSISSLALIYLGQCENVSPRENGNVIRNSSTPRERYRILGLFGHPGKSHFDSFSPLLEELARRGHELTVISHFPRDNRAQGAMSNYHDINLTNRSSDVFVNVIDLAMIEHSAMTTFFELMRLREWGLKNCKAGLYHPEVQNLLKSDAKFDLIITEGFNSDCFLGFVHRFKAPLISLSSGPLLPWIHERISNTDNPSYVPSIFQGYGPEMTFIQRTINSVMLLFIKMFYEFTIQPPTQAIVEDVFGPGVPPLSEIAKNTSLVLTNSHFSLHGSKPKLPSVIEIGGIHISSDVAKLPADIQRFLDDAHEGVLYFSLGSMIKASTMPKDKLRSILKVIGSIPRKVIWKWETEQMDDKPKNLMIKKWLPQNAILNHPNVKCYLAHGGMLGLSEGVQAGVPLIVIPMFGDQFHNAAAAKSRGVAEVLKWSELDENNLRTALDRIFNDTSYEKNARALAKAHQDRPLSPLETAVWWTEYIARGNGIPYLRSAAQDLTWYQQYLLDVILFIALIVLSSLYITHRIIKCLQKLWNRRNCVVNSNGTSSIKKTKKNE